jgi:hypothetical protein
MRCKVILDKAISESVKAIVEFEGEKNDLATKILSWLEAVNTGNEDFEDKASVNKRMEILLNSVK